MNLKFIRGWMAYTLVVTLRWPLSWSMGLLSWCGDYAYWNDPWVRWCREANYRALDLDRKEPF